MATKTLGLTGRDFSTLAAAASYYNALNFTEPEILEVYRDGGPVTDTVAVSLGGWTGGSTTNTLTIRAATGQSFKDHASASTNALRYNDTLGAALVNTLNSAMAYTLGSNIVIENLQLKAVGAYTGLLNAGQNVQFKGCILVGLDGIISSGTNLVIENCVIQAMLSTGLGIRIQQGGAIITDTLIINLVGASGSRGIAQQYDTSPLPIVKNTVVYGFSANFQNQAHANSTNNATNKATFEGTNWGTSGQVNVTSAEWVSLTGGSENFRLVSGSTKLKDLGATAGPTTDIFGTSRPQGSSYDIGPNEYSSAAPPIELASSAISITTASSVLTTSIILSATATAVATSSAVLESNGMVSAASVIATTVSNLTTAIKLLASGAGISAATAALTTTSAVRFSTPVLKNNTGTILANETGLIVNIYNPTTGVLVLRKTGLTSSASGIVEVTDLTGALTAAATYAYEVVLTSNGRRLPTAVTT